MQNYLLKEGFSKISLLLTGGTGFFGKWLLKAFGMLQEKNDIELTVTVLSRDPESFLKDNPEFNKLAWLKFIKGDIRSFELPLKAEFDYVIHGATAASAQLEREQPDEMYSVIVDGTKQILEIVRQCNVQRLLFISSGAVYGVQPPGLTHLPEDYDGVPTTAYGLGKKEAEAICMDKAEGCFECVIARPFAFVGPYLPLDTHFAIGNFMRNCLENQPIVIKGDGTPLRSYLYAADLAEWLLTILLRGKHGYAYNVGSDEAISIKELAYIVQECAGINNPIEIHGTPDSDTLPARYIPCIERAKTELGLSVLTPLSAAIRKTLSWHWKFFGDR